MPTPTAVVVAHPGHELRVFHWMERERPLYCCLTEGSGGSGGSRLASTDAVIAAFGARPGPIYGRYSDRTIYRLLLDGRTDVFVGLARELAGAFVDAAIERVAGDAVEGFNPSHDVCRFIVDGAVALAERRLDRRIHNLEFVLDGPPDACPAGALGEATWLRLDDAALDRKIAAALGYPELRGEVEAALERFGRAAFGVECLRPAATAATLEAFDVELPYYERFGEQRVGEGRYSAVIRYREHVRPVRDAIEATIGERLARAAS